MSYAAVQAALDGIVTAFVAGGDVNTEGTQYQPTAGSPYLSARITAYQRTPLGLGTSTPFEERGFYQVSVNRPATEGIGQAAAVADVVVGLFPRGSSIALPTGNVLTIEYASARQAIPAGDWLTVPVVVSWFCTGLSEG